MPNVTNSNPISAPEFINHQEQEHSDESEDEDETMFINTITTNLESLNQQHNLATNFTEDQDSLLHSPMGLSAENHINMIDFLIKT